MKKAIVCLVSLLVVLGLFPIGSSASHEIMRWQGNHAAAISLAIDDGYLTQFTNVLPLLNERNLKGTFFLITGNDWIPWHGVTWDQWGEVAKQGHEIGSHSVTHPDLTQLSEEEIREELILSQEMINSNITSQSCLSFAYPYCEVNNQVKSIASEYYFAARVGAVPFSRGGGFLNHYYTEGWWFAMNFSEIAGFPIDHSVDYEQYSELHYYLYWAEQLNAWFVPFIHGVADDKTNFYIDFFDDLLTRDFWIAPFGTVVRYMRERLDSTLTVISENDNEMTLNLSHSLDSSIYNIPLTIRSAVPSTWTQVTQVLVREGCSTQIVTPLIEETETVIYYDAIPNGGEILLRGLSSGPQWVIIDVKPGSCPNSINLDSEGVTPVAVLTTSDFDASTVDPSSVLFAGTIPVKWSLEDVDFDGDTDLVLHFNTQDLNLSVGNIEATLTGQIYDETEIGGTEIVGVDTMNIVPLSRDEKGKGKPK